MPRNALPAAVCLLAALFVSPESPPEKPLPRPAITRFVFFAVLEGAYEDGLSNEAVDGILAREGEGGQFLHFVYACPICMPALDALRTYRVRADFYGTKMPMDTFGPGLPEETMERLRSEDIEVRLQTIQGLVQTWISRALDRMRLTPDEQAVWTTALAEGRKSGMQMLEKMRAPGGPRASVKFCAICDAATHACKYRAVTDAPVEAAPQR